MVGHPQRAAERSDPRPGTAPFQHAPAAGPQGTLAGEMLGLHSTIGNRAVTALLGHVGRPVAALGGGRAATIQRQEVDPGLQPAGNPLVGLKRGDGLVFGTFERRTRVRILQERLNAKTGAGLDEDGMFGPRTSEALAAFQSGSLLPEVEPVDPDTADALMDRTAAAGGVAGVPAGSEPQFRAKIVEAGTKLSEAKLSLDLGAATLRQTGGDLATSARPGGPAIRSSLETAADQLIDASNLIGLAGLKMIAGGPSTSPVPVPNQLVGLARGDGLTLGTEDRRPRVGQLQFRLNERMSAGIDVDGMFGPKTAEVLHEFQRSIRVPESDVVDPVTAEALESGVVGEAVAVPGADEMGRAGVLLSTAANLVRLAGTSLSDPNSQVDLGAAGGLDFAGSSLDQVGRLFGTAGINFSSNTRESVEQGAGALLNAGTQLNAVAQGLRISATALRGGTNPGDRSAVASLGLGAGAFDAASGLVVGAGFDIRDASQLMTPSS